MERLKVLFITAWYPTNEQPVGGVIVREHAKAARLYDDVVVLHCAGPDATLKGLWRMEQESDENLTEGIPTYRVWHRNSPIPKTSYLIYLWSAFQAFRRITTKGVRWDIIHAHVFEAALPAVLIGMAHRIPVVVTEHWTLFPRKLLDPFSIWKSSIAFRWAQVVMPVTRSLQQAIEAYGIKARFRVVPNVVDTQLFYPNSSPQSTKQSLKRLLFVGLLDLSHKKGVPYLLQALAQLRRQRDDWHLDIVGDGPARAEYERLAIDSGLAARVTFHGLKSKREVAEFMRQAHLFVLPSLFETFAAVAAEALATGTPVLSTRCGGPEEFIVDDVGMVVPPANAEALWKGLDYMLNHLDRFPPHQLSRYATERFSPERVGEQLHTIYTTYFQRHGGPNAATTKTETH